MYLKSLVTVPDVHGKIVQRAKGNTVYVYYEIGRDYDPSRQFTIPKRVTIGKLSSDASDKMFPNQNFLKYFPDSVKDIADFWDCSSVTSFACSWLNDVLLFQSSESVHESDFVVAFAIVSATLVASPDSIF